MKTALLASLLLATPCVAQDVVVVANGDTVVYVAQKTRTIVRHDHDTVTFMRHDTTRFRESIHEIEPVFIAIKVETTHDHDTVMIQPKERPSILPFISCGLYGLAHTNAEPFIGIGLHIEQGHVGIQASGRMQYYFGQLADPSIGIMLPLKAALQASFEGSLLFYFY